MVLTVAVPWDLLENVAKTVRINLLRRGLIHKSPDHIDLIHNDVKQCFCGSNVYCGGCFKNTHESNMASYFPARAENVKGKNAEMCSDVGGPSNSGSGDLFEFR